MMAPKRKDLTGQKFGKLTAVRAAPPKIWGDKSITCWYCDCDCGSKDVIVPTTYLLSGHTKSCGDCNYRDLSHQKFGLLTPLRRNRETKSKKVVWTCLCDCGNTTNVYADNLLSGKTTSCGCFKALATSQRCKQCNSYQVVDDYIEWKDNNGNVFYTDSDDFEKVYPYCWRKDSQNRIIANTPHGLVKLHRLIMDVINDASVVVDHINHNTCDNRKTNLRVVTQMQNSWNVGLRSNNTSGCTGVRWSKRKQKWLVSITENNRVHYLGYYCNFDEAVRVRKNAEEHYFGQYSYDNSVVRSEARHDDIH